MIIDARKASKTIHGRPFTFSAAVANAIDEIQVGDILTVDGLINQMGFPVERIRLDMLVCKHKGGRTFSIRAGHDGVVATITRLA